MRDDYSALDLFSAAGETPGKRKRLLALPRRRIRSSARMRPFAAFLPLIAKMKKKPATGSALQGWPVALSWSAPPAKAEREDFSAFF